MGFLFGVMKMIWNQTAVRREYTATISRPNMPYLAWRLRIPFFVVPCGKPLAVTSNGCSGTALQLMAMKRYDSGVKTVQFSINSKSVLIKIFPCLCRLMGAGQDVRHNDSHSDIRPPEDSHIKWFMIHHQIHCNDSQSLSIYYTLNTQ